MKNLKVKILIATLAVSMVATPMSAMAFTQGEDSQKTEDVSEDRASVEDVIGNTKEVTPTTSEGYDKVEAGTTEKTSLKEGNQDSNDGNQNQDSNKPEGSGNQDQDSDNKDQDPDNKDQDTGNKDQDADNKDQDKENKDQDSNTQDPTYLYADGYYYADGFTFSGGTGKLKITCQQIKVVKDVATGIITFSSKYITKVKVAGVTYTPNSVGESGSVYEIPLTLNADNTIVATTTAMSEPHDVNYTIHPTLNTTSQPYAPLEDKEAENQYPKKDTDSQDKTDSNKQNQTQKKEETIVTPVKKKTLQAGCTYKIKAATDNRMFYIAPKQDKVKHVILKIKKDGTYEITMSLTGEGYDYLYMGSASKAKKATKKELAKYKVVNGYYTYTFKVKSLDESLTISAHSKRLDRWYEHKIIFYSDGAKRTSKENLATNLKKKVASKKNKEAGTTIQTVNAKNVSTSAVNSATSLADGTYQADGFSWSGGTGRLSYIKCKQIVVKNGKTYATIEFGSSKYDSLKASGQVFSKQGGGNSTFTIPVTLNANNTIVGRTVAMSQPHWIAYSIYISLAAAGDGQGGKTTQASTQELSEEAPEIMGLSGGQEEELEYAKDFKVFSYDKGVKLIQINLTDRTGFYDKKEKKQKDQVEYDEDGQVIAKSQLEYTSEIYQNNVINYLIVPEDVEIPAGLEKEYIIITSPIKSTLVASQNIYEILSELKQEDKVSAVAVDGDATYTNKDLLQAIEKEEIVDIGTLDDPDYRSLIQNKADMAILPDSLLPEEIDDKADKKEQKEQKALIKEAKEKYETLMSRFATLDIPVLVDRSSLEEEDLGKSEWIKVYGAIYGCYDEACALFEKEVKDYEEKESK